MEANVKKTKRVSLPSQRYCYGAEAPETNLELVFEQLRLAGEYYNRLINLERRRRYEVRDATGAFAPDYAELSQKIEQAKAARQELRDEIRALNAEKRSRRPTDESRQLAEQVRVRSEEIRDLAARLKRRRLDLYGDPSLRKRLAALREKQDPDAEAEIAELERDQRRLHGDPELKKILDELDRAHGERVRAARAACGVYWGTYLLIEDDVKRAAGGPRMPRCRPVGRFGRLGVQTQRGISVARAYSGEDTRIQIAAAESTVRRDKAVVRFRIGSTGRDPVFAEVPCWIDRPLPFDAAIKWVTLHRVPRGLDVNAAWELQFTVSSAAGFSKDDVSETGSCGIDINWRRANNSGLCVVCVVGTDGAEDYYSLPERLLGAVGKLAELDSRMDLEFNQARVSLLEFLGEFPKVPEWLAQCTDHLGQWRSHQRLELVVRSWRDQRFAGDEHIFGDVLWLWRGHWIHLCREFAGVRHNVTAHRLDIYRKWAAEWRRRYARVFIEDCNWKKLQDKRPAEDDDGSDAAARRWRTLAAPGTLAGVIRNSGMAVVERPSEDTTRKCHFCGVVGNPDAAEHLIVECADCGRSYNQQGRAAWNLLNDGLAGDLATESAEVLA